MTCSKCGHDLRIHQHGKCGATECPCYTPLPARPSVGTGVVYRAKPGLRHVAVVTVSA